MPDFTSKERSFCSSNGRDFDALCMSFVLGLSSALGFCPFIFDTMSMIVLTSTPNSRAHLEMLMNLFSLRILLILSSMSVGDISHPLPYGQVKYDQLLVLSNNHTKAYQHHSSGVVQ
jgi:hypothetical protein